MMKSYRPYKYLGAVSCLISNEEAEVAINDALNKLFASKRDELYEKAIKVAKKINAEGTGAVLYRAALRGLISFIDNGSEEENE